MSADFGAAAPLVAHEADEAEVDDWPSLSQRSLTERTKQWLGARQKDGQDGEDGERSDDRHLPFWWHDRHLRVEQVEPAGETFSEFHLGQRADVMWLLVLPRLDEG